MTNNEKLGKEGREVPIVEEDFATLLGKFRIKPEVATNISNNISHTGGQTVFENPELLTKKLASWSTEISPTKRKLIIEQWFAERGIEVPEEVIEKAGKGPSELKKDARGKEEMEYIYYVEPDTAIIRLAAGNEKATTLTDAKELQKLIKKDLEEARKTKKKEAKEETGEPAFVVGEGGKWTLNPKGKIGFGEFAVFQMYQDSLKKGEPIDPIEELARREEASSRLKEAMGAKGEDTEMTVLDKLQKLGMLQTGGGNLTDVLAQLDTIGLLRKPGDEGRGTELDMLDKLSTLGMLRNPGDEGRGNLTDVLAQLDTIGLLRKPGDEGRGTELGMLDKLNSLGMLVKPGEAEGVAGQTIRSLEGQIKELRESLQEKEMDTLKNVVVSLSNQVTELRKEIATGGRLEGRYALMDKTIGALDSQLSGLRNDAKGMLEMVTSSAEPRKKSLEDRAKIAKGVKEAVALEREARVLEDELLFGGKTS